MLSYARYFLFILFIGLAVQNAAGTVYYGRQEALDLAFGKGAQVEMLSLFLTPAQITRIEQLARTNVESKLFTFYAGYHKGELLGYAAIVSHTVRTKPMTLLIVLTPAGELKQVRVLAFYEPREYQPPQRWLALMYHQQLSELKLNRGIQGITGATLTSRTAVNSVRKVLAIYQIAVEGKGGSQ